MATQAYMRRFRRGRADCRPSSDCSLLQRVLFLTQPAFGGRGARERLRFERTWSIGSTTFKTETERAENAMFLVDAGVCGFWYRFTWGRGRRTLAQDSG
eukprot:1604793-Prymnesium_polylepis.1